MKILLVSKYDKLLAYSRISLIRNLEEKNYKIFCLCKITDREYFSQLKKFNLTIINCNTENPITLFIYLRKINKINNFDIVFFFTLYISFFGSIFSKILNIKKSFCMIEGFGKLLTYDESLLHPLNLFLGNIILKIITIYSNKIILMNKSNYLYLNINLKTDKKKLIYISSNGINLNIYKNIKKINKLKDIIKYNNSNIYILYLSRLIKYKGIDIFLEISKNFLNENIKFIIVGDNNNDLYGKKIINKINNLSELNKNIIFFKFKDFKNFENEFIMISDIFIFPSFYQEGVPRILLLCQALSIPIISNINPGSLEVIKNKYNGFLINNNNINKYIILIRKLIENKNLYNNICINQKKYISKFDEEKIWKNFVNMNL